jgi:hypothetical protein
VDSAHYDNAYVVVWADGQPWGERWRAGRWREVPYTDAARMPIQEWLEFRALVRPEHNRVWLNLWSAETVREPMQRDTFDKYLRTYVGEGWTLKRLRDTCAVTWVRAGLPLEHLREILGLATLEAVLPYAALVGGNAGRRMQRLDSVFTRSLQPLEAAI